MHKNGKQYIFITMGASSSLVFIVGLSYKKQN